MQLSDFLAILAVIISAVSLIISWRQVSRDIDRLHLRVEYEGVTTGGVIFLMLTNTGRRPVTIDYIEIKSIDHKRLPVQENNFLIRESESREIRIPLAGFVEYEPKEIVGIRVVDTRGKSYHISTRPLWRKWGRAGHLKV